MPPQLAVDVPRDPRSAVAEREEAAPVADALIASQVCGVIG
jgi:hypothetical protein